MTASEKDIWAMFGPFGAVTSVSIVPARNNAFNENNEPTLVATVSMPIYEEAILALMKLSQNPVKVTMFYCNF